MNKGASRHAMHHPGKMLLDVSGLTVRYGNRIALDDVSFSVEPGESVAVLGPNGAGKSTLFKAIAGILPPARGSIHVYGTRPGRHTCIAYLPQRSEVDFSFPATVRDVALMGCAGERGLLRRWRASDRERALECLRVVGLSDLAGRQIGELSGGQQQRLFMARALAQRAELMLLDEPAAGLDLASHRDFTHLLGRLHRLGVTVLLATHNIGLAREHLRRVLLLNRRRTAFGSAEDVLTPDAMAETFEGHVHRLEGSSGGVAAVIPSQCGKEGPS